MNILYIHGLDSKLSAEKREILERFGNVYSPDLNYYEDKNAIDTILKSISKVEIDIVMGSSMGGFAGFHVANILGKPALLYNPALRYRSVEQNIPENASNYTPHMHIVLGQKDEVVNPRDTMDYLMSNFNPVTHFHLHLVPGMGHNIPVEFFENEVTSFFKSQSIKKEGS
ncbi:YqiA/YcfP family alpha/beta fold hydrolase [Salinimicrobium xinjiangense]|uniref:YqiA/YcfP family alpha/beta fold hydrolase n=1 Tax=Salinimicrobium xinjiangense TaxID=438596 RepID=UPI000415EA69|nr:YqiA/YcfP family alpha/beta fold hydrolase [Salinimicrobium xinjiangense]